nr:YvcK family protein [bacterium]
MKKKVCTIGGGTGNFVVLSGLKKYDIDLTAIVAMADNGGSSGILRDEQGVLPPGDVRQCVVALSESSTLMRELMSYRFENGSLHGHSFGNIFLSALEKVTGSFEEAIEELGDILKIKGKVIPVTTTKTHLEMVLQDGSVLKGEKEIYLSEKIDKGYQKIFLTPYPRVNKHAVEEIMNADVIVLGPGGLYTSLISSLLVDGVVEALQKTKAKKVFVVNLMNKKGQTTGAKASHYLAEIEKYTGKDLFDVVLVNSELPD